jgi:MoaA/NifB/PqqE/SkfB family radical SAM enzyme
MLSDSFCSSPWFHLRLTYDGTFEQCRFFTKQTDSKVNVRDTTLMQYYNSQQMAQLRTQLLSGDTPAGCTACYYQDKFGKLSGRIKQLNKSGINTKDFVPSTLSSPHYKYFMHSQEHGGVSQYQPVDLQIDLGNICNSACIMCSPDASSRLQQDYIKLHKINPRFEPIAIKNWTSDTTLLDRVIDEICNIKGLRYIHFLGGETLYDPAFYSICEELIRRGLSKQIIVGTTTNGTIYDSRIEQLISQFEEFHLGISIESVTSLNDYIRYPSDVATIKSNIEQFLKLRDNAKLYVSLRITPNVFTATELDQLFEYMIEKNVIAESCNILHTPAELQIELMPTDLRIALQTRLNTLVDKYQLNQTDITNVRRADLISDVIANVILEYKNFIDSFTPPDNAEQLRYKLVEYIKAFESIRNNSILDHAPDYTDFLRSYGY